eukprot:COSAG04_NODE_9212_length_886_cov_1.252859_2_plen_187_part_00
MGEGPFVRAWVDKQSNKAGKRLKKAHFYEGDAAETPATGDDILITAAEVDQGLELKRLDCVGKIAVAHLGPPGASGGAAAAAAAAANPAKRPRDEATCRHGCGRTVNPGLTRNRNPFDTCCRECTRGQGHSKDCEQRHLASGGGQAAAAAAPGSDIYMELARPPQCHPPALSRVPLPQPQIVRADL